MNSGDAAQKRRKPKQAENDSPVVISQTTVEPKNDDHFIASTSTDTTNNSFEVDNRSLNIRDLEQQKDQWEAYELPLNEFTKNQLEKLAEHYNLDTSGTAKDIRERIEQLFEQEFPNHMRTAGGILKFQTNFPVKKPISINDLAKSELIGLLNVYRIPKPFSLSLQLTKKAHIRNHIDKEIRKQQPDHPTDEDGNLLFDPQHSSYFIN